MLIKYHTCIPKQYIPWNCSFFRARDKSCQRFHNESKTKPNIRGKFFVPFMFICIHKISISINSYMVPKWYFRCIWRTIATDSMFCTAGDTTTSTHQMSTNFGRWETLPQVQCVKKMVEVHIALEEHQNYCIQHQVNHVIKKPAYAYRGKKIETWYEFFFLRLQ